MLTLLLGYSSNATNLAKSTTAQWEKSGIKISASFDGAKDNTPDKIHIEFQSTERKVTVSLRNKVLFLSKPRDAFVSQCPGGYVVGVYSDTLKYEILHLWLISAHGNVSSTFNVNGPRDMQLKSGLIHESLPQNYVHKHDWPKGTPDTNNRVWLYRRLHLDANQGKLRYDIWSLSASRASSVK